MAKHSILLAVGALGGLALVALVAVFLWPVDRDDDVLMVSGEDLATPWCNEAATVCVTAESLAEGYAIYTVEPHPHFRAKGCRAAWLPDFALANVGGEGSGAFRSPCSGATFDRAGHLLFGPSDRDLDRYTAEGRPASFRVRLTRLQRGPASQ